MSQDIDEIDISTQNVFRKYIAIIPLLANEKNYIPVDLFQWQQIGIEETETYKRKHLFLSQSEFKNRNDILY